MGRISMGLLVLVSGMGWVATFATTNAAAPQLTATLSGDYLSTTLTWTGEPGPSGYFLIERSITGSESAPRTFAGIADLQVSGAGPFTFRDETPGVGWNCYRIRAKADLFEYSNEACVVRAGSSLPIPAGLALKNDVPQVPDSLQHAASLSWDPVPASEPFEYVIEVSVPPRAGGPAPYVLLERRPGVAEPRQIIFTTFWLGPYCYRVRVAVEKNLGEPSVPVCVAKASEAAPFDVTNLHVELTPSFGQALLSWDFGSFPAPLTIQRSHTGSFSAPREWQTISADAPARARETGTDYVDATINQAGWYCYRVKVTSDAPDVIWSDEACVARPVVDGPFAPDAGNSPAIAMPGFHYRSEFAIGGIVLLVVALVNWWAFRGYR